MFKNFIKIAMFSIMFMAAAIHPNRTLATYEVDPNPNGGFWINGYYTPQDDMQNEADKYRNTNWNDEVNTPPPSVVIPYMPPSPPPANTLSQKQLQSSLSQGVENFYKNSAQDHPATENDNTARQTGQSNPIRTPLHLQPVVYTGPGSAVWNAEHVPVKAVHQPGFFGKIWNFIKNLF